MNRITTHILDTSSGNPAANVAVELRFFDGDKWVEHGETETDSDGRTGFIPIDTHAQLQEGVYQLTFYTFQYFDSQQIETFYPWVDILFKVPENGEHYHVPLLISPHGYTTYRGS